MSTTTTANLNLIIDNADEPIVNLRTHLNSNLDTIDTHLHHALDMISGLTTSPVNTLAGLSSAPSIAVNLASNSAANVLQASPRPGVTGILGISNGGTGLNSSPSMLTNLGSTSADTVLKASPRPGVTGTLPIANGGTGLTATPSMLINLGSTSADNVLKASPRPGVTGVLPVANGGSGHSVPVSTDVVADVLTMGKNCQINSQYGAGFAFWWWGKIAQIYVAIKVNEAKTPGAANDGDVLATIVSGKRPVLTTPLMNTSVLENYAAAYANGTIKTKKALTAGTTVYLVGTYVMN